MARIEGGKKRRLSATKDLGALKPGARVLDIGAGPGNWALLLAQTAAHVTALEPADAMVDILQTRIIEYYAPYLYCVQTNQR